jgi:hypothetical protein
MAEYIDALLLPGSGSEVHTDSKEDAGRQLAELDGKLTELLDKRELDALVSVTNSVFNALEHTPDAPISPITGRPAASPSEVAAAQRANLMRGFALRRQVLQETLSAPEVADLLGAASRQTPYDRANAGTLIAIRDGGRLRFPLWQFDPQGPDGVLDGLAQTVAELPRQSPLGRIVWFITPKRQLQGRTPLELLRDGEVDPVLAEARAVHAG